VPKPFTPGKLPPKVDYGPLVGPIGRANAAVARLDGLIKNLPNPAILASPLLTKEAVSSSAIEGTQATLDEVLEYEARDDTREDSERTRDIVEIINYRTAITNGIQCCDRGGLGEREIKQLHRTLLSSVRGQGRAPGEFRRHQVHIGKPGAPASKASYIPPEAQLIPRLITDWIRYTHSGQEIDPLAEIGIAHYQFEAIHPFSDGNGRIGRLLIPLTLYEKGILSYPLLYISEYLEAHRREYYERLLKVSTKKDWGGWLQFFLEALTDQARDAQDKVDRILNLYRRYREDIVPNMKSVYSPQFLDFIFGSPFFTATKVQRETGIKNPQTVYNLINRCVELGFVRDGMPDRQRNKVFIFEELVALLR
jgi:Fic family protein